MKVLFTDLDGTLLDEKYDWRKARREIEELKKKGVPLILCSAKTRAEQRKLREEMELNYPYIVEDGSAIVIPKDDELSKIAKSYGAKKDRDELLIKLGVDYNEILSFLRELEKKYPIKYYGNMSVEEVSKVTGLNFKSAELAKKREFSETLVKWGNSLKEIEKKFKARLGGKFVHVYGKNADKGVAVKILTEMYSKLYGKRPITIGIGNHYTDLPMLKAVDIPVIVRNPEGWINVELKGLLKTRGIATDGWIEAVKKLKLI